MSGAEANPRDVYSSLLQERKKRAEQLDRKSRWLSHARLSVFATFAVLCWLAFGTHVAPPASAAAALTVFIVLAVFHDRELHRLSSAVLAVGHYECGIARIDGTWPGTGSDGSAVRPTDHDYADDLDLFGEASLFELLSTARTPMGEHCLASWLCAPASNETIRARQRAVDELRPRLKLREDLASLAEEVRARLDAPRLTAWAEAGGHPASMPLRSVLGAVAAATILSLVLWARGGAPVFSIVGLAAVAILTLGLNQRCKRAVAGLDGAARTFGLLSRVLSRLEAESFSDPLLSQLRGDLSASPNSASKEIARFQRLSDLRDAMRNQFFIPIGAVLLWGPQFSLAIEAWRTTNGPRVAGWLAAVGELEALLSISSYAYEHPSDVFPTMEDESDGPIYDARALGHPLLPAEQRVCNDLKLARGEAACIVSGSNMSGKSTLLRSVGVSVAMAQAGAPVCASALRLSQLALGASLRIVDSLQTGTSHFYAELVRLRRISDLADGARRDAPPLLFLLDEVLHGTNSHDRRVGANAILRSLLDRDSLGLVTTHDLALAKIADELTPNVRNVHFEDRLVEGRLEFDYTLRKGVVERSNALDLMREIGLDV